MKLKFISLLVLFVANNAFCDPARDTWTNLAEGTCGALVGIGAAEIGPEVSIPLGILAGTGCANIAGTLYDQLNDSINNKNRTLANIASAHRCI